METLKSVARLRKHIGGAKTAGKSVALVPTMGALHEGHGACVDVARKLGDILVVSIFVNPTQFGPTEDFDKYPAVMEEDLRLCEAWGCDVAFAPAIDEMYAGEQQVWIDVGLVSEPLCGRSRSGHFRGVATVVAKLFHIVEPDIAVFGQKDAQQALVIRRMVEQLAMPVSLALSPTVRETDGLAYSSRNRYLSPHERKQASSLFAALRAGRAALEGGERIPGAVCAAVRDHLRERGIVDVEYVELLAAHDLTSLERARGRVLLAAAVRVGSTRLIDNIVLNVAEDGVRETPLF